MPYYRLLAVFAPLLGVLLGIAVDCLPIRRLAAVAVPIVVCSFFFLHSWTTHSWTTPPDAKVAEAEPCWQTLSEKMKPALLPSDVVALDVVGVFPYKNPGVYVHDTLGLTDRHLAHNGSMYVPQMGKMDHAYTYYKMRPDVILRQFGLRTVR